MEAAPTQIAFFLVAGAAGADAWDKVAAAAQAVDGVRGAKPTGLTVMATQEIEVAVTLAKGKASPQDVVAALAAAGYKAEVEALDTWTIGVQEWQGSATGAEERALAAVAGVVSVARPSKTEIRVTAYAPHVTTARLLGVLPKASGASVQTETARLSVKGAAAGDLEGVRAKLAQAWGVLEAKTGKDGVVEVVREKGRAGLACLNRALRGTPWTVEAAG